MSLSCRRCNQNNCRICYDHDKFELLKENKAGSTQEEIPCTFCKHFGTNKCGKCNKQEKAMNDKIQLTKMQFKEIWNACNYKAYDDSESYAVNKRWIVKEKEMDKLTKESFLEICREIWRNPDKGEDQMVVIAKQAGWIAKDDIEQAIQDADEFYEYQYELAGQYFDKAVVIEFSEKYRKLIELLQNKVKELSE
jgi:hypothetical protein